MSFQWLAGVNPVWGTALVCVLYVVVLLWVLTRPKRVILEEAKDQRRWRDLRLWVLPLLVIQIALYIAFR